MADGNKVSGGKPEWGNAYEWYAYLYPVVTETKDDYVKVKWVFGITSRWALQISASADFEGACGRYFSTGNSLTSIDFKVTGEYTYSRNSSSYPVNKSGYITWSGFGGGKSTVSCTYTVPAHPYYNPEKPKNLSVKRVSDSVQELTVELPQNNANWRDYTKTYFYRHTNGGDTETLYNQSIVSNYRDATTKKGNMYTYDCRVMGKNGVLSDMSNVVTVYTAPTAIGSITVSKNEDSTVSVEFTDKPRYLDGIEVQSSLDNFKTAHTVDLEGKVDKSPLGGTVKYRARAYKKNPVNSGGEILYGDWTVSNEITTLCAPNAPLVTARSVYALSQSGTADITLAIAANHPDGTGVSACEVEYSVDGGSTVAASADSAAYVLRADGAHSYRARARTMGVQDYGWGAWSEWVGFSTAYPPTGYFTTPGEDGFVLGELPFDIAWSVADDTGISHVDIALLDSHGDSVVSYSGDGSESAWELNRYSVIENNTAYRLRGTVRNGKGLETVFERAFSTSWLTPAPPTILITYNDDLSVTLATSSSKTDYAVNDTGVEGPISLTKDGLFMAGRVVTYDDALVISGTAECTSFDMARKNPDGSVTQLVTGAGVGAFVFDRLPPLNTDYTYAVTAYADSGTFITFEVSARCDSGGDEAFNFGDAGETCLRLGLNAKVNRTKSVSGNTFHFAHGRGASPLPTFYPDGDLDVSGSHSYVSYGRDRYDETERITDDPFNSVCWWRGAFGRVARVAVTSWGLDYGAQDYSLWTISPSLIEVDWEEPLR